MEDLDNGLKRVSRLGDDRNMGTFFFGRVGRNPLRRGAFEARVASPDATPLARQYPWAFVIRLCRSFRVLLTSQTSSSLSS